MAEKEKSGNEDSDETSVNTSLDHRFRINANLTLSWSNNGAFSNIYIYINKFRIIVLPAGRCRFLEESESGLRFPRNKIVSRKADQIQRQCLLFSVAKMALEGNRKTIALVPKKGLLIREVNSNSLLLK